MCDQFHFYILMVSQKNTVYKAIYTQNKDQIKGKDGTDWIRILNTGQQYREFTLLYILFHNYNIYSTVQYSTVQYSTVQYLLMNNNQLWTVLVH